MVSEKRTEYVLFCYLTASLSADLCEKPELLYSQIIRLPFKKPNLLIPEPDQIPGGETSFSVHIFVF